LHFKQELSALETMAPCELKKGGILRELGIFGPKIERPLFEVVQFLPTESFTKDFWVNRLRSMYFNQMIEIDAKNGNDNNVLFTLLVVSIHFPDAFSDPNGINLSKLYNAYYTKMSSRTKMIIVSSWHVQSRSEKCVLSAIVQEILQMKITESVFERDEETQNRIHVIKENLLMTT
jgi:hypothetical protein